LAIDTYLIERVQDEKDIKTRREGCKKLRPVKLADDWSGWHDFLKPPVEMFSRGYLDYFRFNLNEFLNNEVYNYICQDNF
jgi:hypothetical protein